MGHQSTIPLIVAVVASVNLLILVALIVAPGAAASLTAVASVRILPGASVSFDDDTRRGSGVVSPDAPLATLDRTPCLSDSSETDTPEKAVAAKAECGQQTIEFQ